VLDGFLARRAQQQAGALIDARKFAEALEPAEEACRRQPEWADAHWHRAIALKHARRWGECLAACDRVLALDPGSGGGVHWNAGIAATALGDWARARRAWRAYGVDVPEGEGPLAMDLGLVGVRVAPADNPEVVFCTRLDPCRARVVSVPWPVSRRRHGDVVLFDGEGRGKRRVDDRMVTVFDELQVMEPSDHGTWSITAVCSGPSQRDELVGLLDGVACAVEDWTESVERVCADCSLGEHDHADHPQPTEWQRDRELGVALRHEADLEPLRSHPAWRRDVQTAKRVL
jgi:hypothetical protein